MERYEYRLEKTPSKSTKYKGLSKSDDAFAHTLMDGMNALAQDGWQFLRTETMTEQVRSLIGGKQMQAHEYMIYRRPLRSDGMSLQDPIAPRRVRYGATPDPDTLRERVARAIQEPKRATA